MPILEKSLLLRMPNGHLQSVCHSVSDMYTGIYGFRPTLPGTKPFLMLRAFCCEIPGLYTICNFHRVSDPDPGPFKGQGHLNSFEGISQAFPRQIKAVSTAVQRAFKALKWQFENLLNVILERFCKLFISVVEAVENSFQGLVKAPKGINWLIKPLLALDGHYWPYKAPNGLIRSLLPL
jgi:hypothetical protein